MKEPLRNYSLLNNNNNKLAKLNLKYGFLAIVLFFSNLSNSQTANYVNNGGFEEYFMSGIYSIPRYWGATDSLKPFGELLTYPDRVPSSSYTYQWPRHGKNHLISLLYCPTCLSNKRVYSRNRLKKMLKAGETYCVSFYVNLSDQSTHGIDAIGAYFSDNTIDTITKCNHAITYLLPQIKNPTNNIITDTMNWIPITGTFVANGTEKYMLIGNFKSDANTNTFLVNSANLPANAGDYLIDDVSCINIDLPAFAGQDQSIIPSDSAFIGRSPDVGIDEACMWYKLPTVITPTTPALDTVAGLWVKPAVTTTYVVKQQLWCSSVKYDTVVVNMNLVGLEKLKMLSEQLKIYPVPASDYVELRIANEEWMKEFSKLSIFNNLGLLIREEEIRFENKSVIIRTNDLSSGVYSMVITNTQNETVTKKLLIAK